MSLWRNNEADWQLMVSLIIGGLIAILIVSRIRMYIKNAKDEASE
ncbi:hypothetical protein [Amphibacillus sediminis]|nr:hypothetical protein [Amphibacillus sediminis]